MPISPPESPAPRTALVLIDHGSRSAEANLVVETTARELAAAAPGRFVAVLAAHMELATPTLEDAFAAAAVAGAELVVVGLFFLAPGRHSSRDIPRLAATAAAGHPGLRFLVTDALGPDPRLQELTLLRAEQAIAEAGSAAAPPPNTKASPR